MKTTFVRRSFQVPRHRHRRNVGIVRFRFRLNRGTTTPDFDVAMKEEKDRAPTPHAAPRTGPEGQLAEREIDEPDATSPLRHGQRDAGRGIAVGPARVVVPPRPDRRRRSCCSSGSACRRDRATRFTDIPPWKRSSTSISGRAEQWVDRASRPLGPGESAHIPRDVVHGTYNAGDETLVFLAILSPAIFEGPALVDVSREEPWASLRPTSGSGATAR